jgi:hypothetical protein
MSGSSDDLLDAQPVLGQADDRGIGILPAKIAFILDALGRAEQIGIDRCRPDDGPDLAH